MSAELPITLLEDCIIPMVKLHGNPLGKGKFPSEFREKAPVGVLLEGNL